MVYLALEDKCTNSRATGFSLNPQVLQPPHIVLYLSITTLLRANLSCFFVSCVYVGADLLTHLRQVEFLPVLLPLFLWK